MKRLCLIRGLPGSGKSMRAFAEQWNTLGNMPHDHCEADQFFVGPYGEYSFNPWQLGEAHAACQIRCLKAMQNGAGLITVANTFSQQWEMAMYRELAQVFGYTVEVIDLFDAGLTDKELAERCVHGCPAEKIAQMRARWEQ